MASRIYDIIFKCGCMISLDGGGGLIPCHAEYGDMKKRKNRKQLELHNKCWADYYKSKLYKIHSKEIQGRNS